jgi:peptidoglycan/LPS O-acetylase OafA/YrhL
MRIGKVSYGVYLFHLFIPELWGWILAKFNSWNIDLFFNNAMPAALKEGWLFVQHFALLMLLCALSWKFIEKPVNNLKKLFENKPLVKVEN